jgi:hypothetical protein
MNGLLPKKNLSATEQALADALSRAEEAERANAAMREAFETMRDRVLHDGHQLEGMNIESDVTNEERNSMTKERMRIVILEWLGWTDIWQPCPNSGLLLGRSPGGKTNDDKAPNHPEDLNAMHEEEEKLSHYQRRSFMSFLSTTNDWTVCHATAAQRAEALIRTLGKWEG